MNHLFRMTYKPVHFAFVKYKPGILVNEPTSLALCEKLLMVVSLLKLNFKMDFT
jgi:hypothetical protein